VPVDRGYDAVYDFHFGSAHFGSAHLAGASRRKKQERAQEYGERQGSDHRVPRVLPRVCLLRANFIHQNGWPMLKNTLK
jgi:hypothetical protein